MTTVTDLLNWEKLDDANFRLKVPGGWVLKSYEDVAHLLDNNSTRFDYNHDWRIATCFIPDPNYNWLAGHTILNGE